MYYKDMLSAEILKEIKQIMRTNVLTDYEKCVIIKNFCNNLVDSDVIHGIQILKRRLQNE